jgi:hypothetical protein
MPNPFSLSGRPANLLACLSLVVAQLAPAPALLAPIGLSVAAAQSRSTNVSCYSEPGRTRTCRIPSETADVRYVGNDGACVEGRTWRWSGSELQVRDGCGGNFRISYGSGGGSSGGGWGGSGGGWGGSGSGYEGEIRCKSQNNRYQRCSVRTEGRVTLVRQHSNASCSQGRSWGYDNSGIWVDNGCEATFAYGRGNYNPGQGSGGWGGSGGSNWGNGYRGEVRCRSNDNRYNRCSVNTEGRVVLVEQLSRAECRQGRTWGYDNSGIWVNNGCEARFAYGRGNYQPQYGSSGSSGGSNTGAVVGGVALAAGLVALLAAAGRSSTPSATSATTTATVDADYGLFPRDAEASGRACMAEAARQVGATGGTRVRLDRVDMAQREGQGWNILAKTTLTYPQQERQVSMDCRTNGTAVTAFDVR